MAIVVDREINPSQPLSAIGSLGSLGWLGVAGAASMAAGAIHAAAIGVHSEHSQAVVAFALVAAVQIGWGALAFARPGRIVIALGALANLLFIAGWVAAKTNGIWFIDGLDGKEAIQTADVLAVGLAASSVVAAVGLAWSGVSRWAGRPVLMGGLAVLVSAVAVPGMVSAGTHAHADDEAHAAVATDADDPAHQPAVVPPRAFDPLLPIDLGGVEGVSLEEQARAENLLAITLLRLPKFADPAFAEANGFVSIGDGFLGAEHYLNAANMNDDKLLDPDYPESLVYDTSVTPKRLVAAMFMLNPGDTLDDAPVLGGKLTQWHIHDNLCFAGAQVAGLTDADGNCGPGLSKGAETPMIHVWIEPHPCGPFAALEGVAGGSIPEGEARLCDAVHGQG